MPQASGPKKHGIYLETTFFYRIDNADSALSCTTSAANIMNK